MDNELTTEAQTSALSAGDLKSLALEAVKSGNDNAVAALERILDMAERVADREARQSFNRAFAKFRKSCPVIRKTTHAKVVTKNGGTWEYDYAKLEHIQEAVDPLLEAAGFFYSFSSDESSDRTMTVSCTLVHEDGHSETSRVTIRKGGANQRVSEGQQDVGTLTTARRNALTMVLGIATSDPEEPPAAPAATITGEEAITLEEYLAALDEGATGAFLRAYKIGAVHELPAHKYAGALAQLKKRTGADD